MAKNLSRKYATMTEDERRQFALGRKATRAAGDAIRGAPEAEGPLASPREEIADPEHRDGLSALLDEEAHRRAVLEQPRTDDALDVDQKKQSNRKRPEHSQLEGSDGSQTGPG